MEVKDVDTNQSLNSENTIHQNLISYGKEMNQTQVLTLALGSLDCFDENFVENIINQRQQLQQTLEKIERSKNNLYQSHNAVQKMTEYVDFFSFSTSNQSSQKTLQNSLAVHHNFIEGIQGKVETLISKVQAWRNKRILINKIKARNLRINGLIHKKYNMKNYIQQMQLVKGLLSRVGNRLGSGDFDHVFLEELMSKELIPYHFYHNYCYNIIFYVISTRIKENSLIVFKKNQNLIELFQHMKNFFSKDLYQNCHQFIRLMKHIRIVNHQNICIDEGFANLFKPFFVQILEEIDEIQCTTFLKARSLMQYNDFTIQTWKEYEQLLLEKYIFWTYEQYNNLNKTQLIHLVQLKQSITFFKKNYQWINIIAVKSNKIHGNNDFPYELLKASLLKIFKPIITQIYYASIPDQNTKYYEKHKKQFQKYWLYCIFGKYQNIYNFIGNQLRNYLGQIKVNNKNNAIDDSELNIDQYYQYYQQMEEVLSETLENKKIGKEFQMLWHECWLRFCCLSRSNSKLKLENESIQEIDHVYHIKQLEIKLEQCLANKKAYKKDERTDMIYGLLMNLNLNSSRYFLLREAIKCIDKSIQKEINLIRDVAYKQLFG